MNEILLSDTQLKLVALLVKSKDLVPFASDAECEMMFQKLVFAQVLLAEKARRLSLRYREMTLEALVESGSGGGAPFFLGDTAGAVMEESSVVTKKVPAPAKSERSERSSAPVGEPKRKKEKMINDECVLWNVHLNPNVTEITMIQDVPLKIIFLARPSGQGKHTPISCFATEQVIIDLDRLEKTEKVEQQKRRRIFARISSALLVYGSSNVLPESLRLALEKTEWGAEILGKLQFTIQ